MPRVYYVKKARKAIKSAGIKVGDSYYWWKFRYGGKRVSKTRPRGSQLTQSEKISNARAAAESLEDIDINDDTTLDELQDLVSDIESTIDEIAEEYRDNISNMPESLQSSPTAEAMEESADQLESWASDVGQCLDSIDEDEEDWRENARNAIQEAAGQCPL